MKIMYNLRDFGHEIDGLAGVNYFGFGEHKLWLYLSVSIENALEETSAYSVSQPRRIAQLPGLPYRLRYSSKWRQH